MINKISKPQLAYCTVLLLPLPTKQSNRILIAFYTKKTVAMMETASRVAKKTQCQNVLQNFLFRSSLEKIPKTFLHHVILRNSSPRAFLMQ